MHSIARKIFATITTHRLRAHIKLDDAQNGFRKNRQCCDHAAILHDLIKDAKNKRKKLYVAILDFKKAFDNVHLPTLIQKLKDRAVPAYIINAIK